MAENNANNGDGGPNPATPSKRAEKKQDTRPTPERIQTGMMEIDSDVAMEIQDPPRLHSTNKEGKESESKEGGVIDMSLNVISTNRRY